MRQIIYGRIRILKIKIIFILGHSLKNRNFRIFLFLDVDPTIHQHYFYYFFSSSFLLYSFFFILFLL